MVATPIGEENWDPARVTPEIQTWEELSPTQLGDYTRFCIDTWRARNTRDAPLWGAYYEAFGRFTLETFRDIPARPKGELRDFLRQNGTFIPPTTRAMATYQALYDAAQALEQPIWPEEELSTQIEHSDGLTSRLNAAWAIEHGKTPLPRVPGEPISMPRTPDAAPRLYTTRPPLTPATTQRVQPRSGRLIHWQRDEPIASTEEPEDHRQASITPTPNPYYSNMRASENSTPQPTEYPKAQYTKELSTLSKMYNDSMKYNGFGDNFERKLGIFRDICFKAGLPEDGKPLALSFMLKDSALDFYYDSISPKQPLFPMACAMITTHFEGPEWQQDVKNKWDTTTLTTTITGNPEKSTAECLQIMLRDLSNIQHGLRGNQRDVDTLREKVIDACRGVPATANACSNPSPTFGAFINQLKSSILTYESLPGNAQRHQYPTEEDSIDTNFTDRRFRRRDAHTGRPQYTGRTQYTGRSQYRPGDRSGSKTRNNRCFICRKPDCRSYRHPQDEQDAAWKKYRDGLTPRIGQRLDNRAKQFIANIESPEPESDKEVDAMLQLLNLEDSDTEDENTTFFTTQGPVPQDTAKEIYHSLCVNSTFHAITQSPAPSNYDPGRGHYSCQQFFGILIDTGAAKHSTCGYGQFLALQSTVTTKLDTQAPRHGFRFGMGKTTSLGSTNIPLPIGNVIFYVVQADTPFLLSLADMTRHQVYLNNVSRKLVRHGPIHQAWPIIEHRGHMFLNWKNREIPSTAYPSELDVPQLLEQHIDDAQPPQMTLTDQELRRLHRRFGHPSVHKLRAVLERAGYDDISSEIIRDITKYCHFCQKYSRAPGRFKFTVRDNDQIQFNHTIFLDIMYIDGSPILHVVDDATALQAARWLPDMSTKSVWNALRQCWIDVYVGPPDHIVTDAGKNLTSKEFQQHAGLMGSTTKAVPVEAHWSIGKVERYHAVLRRAYEVITAESTDIDKITGLQMAVKAVNDTAGPNGLVPTLLAFGAMPKISQFDAPAPSLAARALAVQKATAEIARIHAQRAIRDAINTRNGPDTELAHDLPTGSQVLVWREGPTGRSGYWTGPHTLLSLTNEECEVQLDRNHSTPAKFRTTQVKPYFKGESLEDAQPLPNTSRPGLSVPITITANVIDPPERRNPARQRRLPGHLADADIEIHLQDDDDLEPTQALLNEYAIFTYTRPTPYAESRAKEIDGLIEKGVFEIVPRSAIPAGTRVFTSRFVDQIKFAGTLKEQEKSRLVVRAYQDHGKEDILVQSPTIQRASQRVILAVTALLRHDLYLRDITQAYVQSTTTLNRPFYVRPPPNMGFPDDVVLYILKPLYGIPEAGNHWFHTYHGHYTKRLQMQPSTYDPCLLHSTNSAFGLLGLQTDDTIGLFSPEFATAEEEHIQAAGFASKPREMLTNTSPLKFNGGLIQLLDSGEISLSQEQHCRQLQTITEGKQELQDSRGKSKYLSRDEQYVSLRAKGAYIATMCQPEAAYDLSVAAQMTDRDDAAVKALNKRLQWQFDNATRGLKYVPLGQGLELIVFTDASFANNKDLSSQIGYVIVLADKTGTANILHWSSTKCKRVTRSVLGAELYAMAHGFDMGASIKTTLDAILPTFAPLPLILCTDSKSLYDCIVKLGTTQEKRLMIDVMCLRQSYERREITECRWIEGSSNPADAMTKKAPCAALQRLINENRVLIKPKEWVERPNQA